MVKVKITKLHLNLGDTLQDKRKIQMCWDVLSKIMHHGHYNDRSNCYEVNKGMFPFGPIVSEMKMLTQSDDNE